MGAELPARSGNDAAAVAFGTVKNNGNVAHGAVRIAILTGLDIENHGIVVGTDCIRINSLIGKLVPNPDNIHITACELKAEQGHASVRQESRASAQGKLSVISVALTEILAGCGGGSGRSGDDGQFSLSGRTARISVRATENKKGNRGKILIGKNMDNYKY